MSLTDNLPNFKSELKADLLALRDGMNEDTNGDEAIGDLVDKIADRIDQHIRSAVVLITGQPPGTLE